MPWQERTVMTERLEFVLLANQEDANLQRLCARFGISRKTGYKWLSRWRSEGSPGLVDRSRRPRHSPLASAPELEARVVAARDAHPTWGARKLRTWLEWQGEIDLPSVSTVTAILCRHGRVQPPRTPPPAVGRFEAAASNDLWQLDFMGHRALQTGRVHPLSLLDDHSRFALRLTACPDQRHSTVQSQLQLVFERYGLPHRILTDNGPPWGPSGMDGLTGLEVWLLRLGIRVSHGRPYHPQTQGKVERFHRTVRADVFANQTFASLAHCQRACDRFRHGYNLDRPHQALDMRVPASRYQPSPRPYPRVLPPIEYGPDDALRTVKAHGVISFHNRNHFVGRGIGGLTVAVRPTAVEGVFTVHFAHQQVHTIDLRVESMV